MGAEEKQYCGFGSCLFGSPGSGKKPEPDPDPLTTREPCNSYFLVI